MQTTVGATKQTKVIKFKPIFLIRASLAQQENMLAIGSSSSCTALQMEPISNILTYCAKENAKQRNTLNFDYFSLFGWWRIQAASKLDATHMCQHKLSSSNMGWTMPSRKIHSNCQSCTATRHAAYATTSGNRDGLLHRRSIGAALLRWQCCRW